MNRMPSRRIFLLAALLGVVALAIALTLREGTALAHGGEDHGAAPSSGATSGDSVIVSQAAQFLLGIRTILADTAEVADGLRVQGTLAPRPNGEALVSAPQAGRITSGALPTVGGFVRAGQTLAVVEGSLAAPERAGLQAERAAAIAERDQAAADVERLRALERVVARREIEAAEIRLRGAQARLEALGAALGSLNRYALTAPISGVLAEVNATLGQQVDAGQPLFRIVDLSRLYVQAAVFEDDLPRLQGGGARAIVTVPALEGRTFEGRLVTLGSVVDPQSRTVPAVFEVTNPGGVLRAGQRVEVDVLTGTRREAIVVPEEALVRAGETQAVFVHPTPEAFVLRRVGVGQRMGGLVVIESGISGGERVVTTGAYSLRAAR